VTRRCLGASNCLFLAWGGDGATGGVLVLVCRCSGAVGWLVNEQGSQMPLVISSFAVTDFSPLSLWP